MARVKLFFFFLVFLSVSASAQIEFEEGYIIDMDSNKIEALIKNEDWRDTPNSFRYKLSDADESKLTRPEDVLEFGINGKYRFISRRVQIDLSSEDPNKMNEVRSPQYESDHLFLQVILVGQADLYQYRQNDLIKYFYSLDGIKVVQLIYRKYKVEGQIATNNFFRYQLYEYLKCPAMTLETFEVLDYKKRDLIKLFTAYSQCYDTEVKEIVSQEKRELLNLTLRPGIRFTSLQAVWGNQGPMRKYDYGSQKGTRIGLDIELVIPHNKNKWAITLEPTYQYFRGENTAVSHYEAIYGVEKSIVNYQSLEIPIGVRHYFFLNDEVKIFVDAGGFADVNFGSKMDFLDNDGQEIYVSRELESALSFGYGAGVKMHNRYVIGTRFQTYRDLFNNIDSWYTSYKQFSVFVGYSLLRVKN